MFNRMKLLDYFRSLDQFNQFNFFKDTQFKWTKKQIIAHQKKKFNYILSYHYNHNPQYRNYLLKEGFNKLSNNEYSDVPIITKDYFFSNKLNHSILNNIHITKNSGGSSGNPLTYYLSKESASNVWPQLWRAFEVYSVKPCEKLLMLAGPSLFGNRSFKRIIYDFINQFYVYSAFDLTDKLMNEIFLMVKKKGILAIYGYTSSILLFFAIYEEKQLSP